MLRAADALGCAFQEHKASCEESSVCEGRAARVEACRAA